MDHGDTYLAKPLVVHRATPITRAELVARKTRMARRRLLKGYKDAGTKKYRLSATTKLIGNKNMLEDVDNSRIYDVISHEIKEAVNR